ncbi:hypothetical protein GKE82_05880 [Conexibacter sp. W3-3-2]|uniref:hypothetical protein n=1 Tax=Conexibacter sp. W3-3-2 TaxID=2675227 RepID=UPI0012B96F9F|nr:hypothetical protein [Conexibacter sp. W3-3-2]MTD43845.1 hypothetical protein [Conexibacter sp. W3-3-2]
MPRGGLSQDPEKRARQLAGLKRGQEAPAARLADPDYTPKAREPAPRTATEQVTAEPAGDVHVLTYPDPPPAPKTPPAAPAPDESAPEPQEIPDREHHPEDAPKPRKRGFLDGFRSGLD